MIFNLISKAKELFYSNKNSNLNASNVQDAIDELNNNLAQCLVMEKYVGTNCALYRVGNFVFLSINRNPNVKTLPQYSIIATKPQVPFEFHLFQANIMLNWVTNFNNQSGAIRGYLQNDDVRISNAVSANDNIISMNGLMIGYVGATI